MTKLKLLRILREVRQQELARQVGIARPYLSSIEGGWARPSPRVAERIAAELGVQVEWLFGRIGNDERH